MREKSEISEGRTKVRVPEFLLDPTSPRSAASKLKIIEVKGRTVADCIDQLEIQFPGIKQQLCDEQGQLQALYAILMNSESLNPRELTRPVEDGELLTILPLLGGG